VSSSSPYRVWSIIFATASDDMHLHKVKAINAEGNLPVWFYAHMADNSTW
jgi:hypothetical protein